MEQKIVLLKLNDKKDEYTRRHQLKTDALRKETFRKIGSEFDKSNGSESRDLIRGLDAEQERVFLPSLIGISANNVNFSDRVKDFWSDFTIIPTVEGIKLNIATEKKTTDEGKDIETPVNLTDYMTYKFAMASSRVAKTENELDNLQFYDFYLVDLTIQKAKDEKQFSAKRDALISFSRLVAKFEDNKEKIDWILEMTKEERSFFNVDMPQIDKEMLLQELADRRPMLFNSLIDDKQLETKAFLSKAVTYLVITKEGNDFFYMEENIGSEVAALAWLTNATKSQSVAAIKAKIEQLILQQKTK